MSAQILVAVMNCVHYWYVRYGHADNLLTIYEDFSIANGVPHFAHSAMLPQHMHRSGKLGFSCAIVLLGQVHAFSAGCSWEVIKIAYWMAALSFSYRPNVTFLHGLLLDGRHSGVAGEDPLGYSSSMHTAGVWGQ